MIIVDLKIFLFIFSTFWNSLSVLLMKNLLFLCEFLYNLPFLALIKDFYYHFFTVLDSNVLLHLPFFHLYLSTNFHKFSKLLELGFAL